MTTNYHQSDAGDSQAGAGKPNYNPDISSGTLLAEATKSGAGSESSQFMAQGHTQASSAEADPMASLFPSAINTKFSLSHDERSDGEQRFWSSDGGGESDKTDGQAASGEFQRLLNSVSGQQGQDPLMGQMSWTSQDLQYLGQDAQAFAQGSDSSLYSTMLQQDLQNVGTDFSQISQQLAAAGLDQSGQVAQELQQGYRQLQQSVDMLIASGGGNASDVGSDAGSQTNGNGSVCGSAPGTGDSNPGTGSAGCGAITQVGNNNIGTGNSNGGSTNPGEGSLNGGSGCGSIGSSVGNSNISTGSGGCGAVTQVGNSNLGAGSPNGGTTGSGEGSLGAGSGCGSIGTSAGNNSASAGDTAGTGATTSTGALSDTAGITANVNGFFNSQGQALTLEGMNGSPEAFADISPQQLEQNFPGLNAIRLNVSPSDTNDPDIAQDVQNYTAAGIAVELEVHDDNGQISGYDSTYEQWASEYKNNPLVMLETPNEPGGGCGQVASQEAQYVEEIRSEGFNNPIGLQPTGGYNEGDIPSVLSDLQQDGASTSNLYVTPHIYYSGSSATGALSYAEGEISGAQSNGLPALIDEYGCAMNGYTTDPEGQTVLQAMDTLGQSGYGSQSTVGSIFWNINQDHGCGADSAYSAGCGQQLSSGDMTQIGDWLAENTLSGDP